MPKAPEPRRAPRIDAHPDPSDPAVKHAQALLAAAGLARPIPPRAGRAGPALEWARSGAMALTGEPEGPPGFANGGLATAACGAGLALAALAPAAGFEDLDAAALLGERAALFGFERRGHVSCGGSARIMHAGDGALVVNLPRDDDWRLLDAWLETSLGIAAATRDWASLERAIARRGAVPLIDRGREIGLAVALAAPASEVRARPFRLELETRHRPPPSSSESPAPAPRSAAAVDAHAARRRRHRRPRVLDLSTLWAGPLAGALLAQAGFDVLKLESATRPDGARLGEPTFFDRLHAGKRGGTVDLFAARDRELFARLLDATDIVLESARPRGLAQLGFDARAWVEARPGRIWASITGYGREQEWIAFGDDAAVAAGLAYDPPTPTGDASIGSASTARVGRPASAPRFCADAVADPLTGLYAAVAIAGLYSAGRGGLLSLALAEVAAHAALAAQGEALSLPLAARCGAWAVLDGDRWHCVAPPRARGAAETARAPALRPLDAALFEDWTRPC